MPLLLLFIVMPVVEMWVLIKVGQHIGAAPTIGLVLLTAAVGYALLKQQGFETLFRARQKMASGELPAREMAEGLILAVSGALLLTPGFCTDAIGFVGLIPFTRRRLVNKIIANMQVSGYQAYSQTYTQAESPEYEVHHNRSGKAANKTRNTLEGEFWREDDNKNP
ncbi:MAG: FxsA family protein [Pseudomonadales bacterium]|nr:FxsA family protein [Pseudomonadales bacterium]MCP5170786.1 FxsA family protein [Pseudomonadales bacterium]MCP5301973.1 FxsA family protein [Pseudomonadales bacterium]